MVVLGAGAAGMAAACVAAAEGLRVLLLEKSAHVGGTTAISGGMVWAPNSLDPSGSDSPEQAAAYLDATVPTAAGRDLREAYLAAAPRAIAYLQQHTEVRLQPVPLYPDYYPEARGATSHGRVLEPVPYDARRLGAAFEMVRPPLPEFTLFGGMMIARPDIAHFRSVFRSPKSAFKVARLLAAYAMQRLAHHRGTELVLGNALVARLLQSLLDRSVPIRRNVEVVRLERRGDRIGAVVVRDGSGERAIEARRAVILATGGFSHDAKLREQFLPAPARALSAAVGGATGDGLRLGAATGGRLTRGELGTAYWSPVSHYRDRRGRHVVFPHTVTDRAKPGVIAVNAEGRRFTNEAVSYHQFVTEMLREANAGSAIPARLICDKRFLWKYGLGAIKPMTLRQKPYLAAGYLSQGATLSDLARVISVDPAELKATVERYNHDAGVGVDSEFGRGGDVYQRFLGDSDNQPNPCMAPIETPPFYSIALYPADLGTACGLATNSRAQVLTEDGRPIAGLYACGNDMNSIMQGAYPGPGITIGPALVFAFLAAMHAAGVEN